MVPVAVGLSKWVVAAAALVLLWSVAVVDEASAQAANGKKVGQTKGPAMDAASTHYIILDPLPSTGQERVLCLARGRCYLNILRCPKQCPIRKPKRNKIVKGCFMDCSSRCETTCKKRKPNCNGYGSICYDPRFVGGDGVMFYFHGATGGDFALVSDDKLHINAHFIGTRPAGRARDFTWVQALSVMFDTHTLVVAAKKVAKWNDDVDALMVRWDDQEIQLPADADAEWRSTYSTVVIAADDDDEETNTLRSVVVERTAETNSVKVRVSGLLEMDVEVTPIGEEEDRIHGYHIPQGDAFAHLEMQFKFGNLTEQVEGVLGKTYQPGYVSPVKRGVAMPMMGGEDRYRTPSLLSTTCAYCRFRRPRTSGPSSKPISSSSDANYNVYPDAGHVATY